MTGATKRRSPARRARGGDPGALLPRRLWLLAMAATAALYWLLLLRIGGAPAESASEIETADGAATSEGLERAREAAERLYDGAEGANLRRNDDLDEDETEAPEVTEPEPTAEEVVPFEQRHVTLSGYDATLAYLESYAKPEGSNEELFLFFVCSDEQGREFDWRRLCAEAKETVYEVFAKAPSSKRLVTIYAGTKTDWTTKNRFFDDQDLRVKAIPSVMKWEGGTPGAKRATSDMMIESTLLYEPLLRYVFGNKDKSDPLLDPDDVATKEIVDVKGFQEYADYMQKYNADPNSKPMYLMLISGRMPGNDRLWCPYCRYSHASVEYGFFAYAPRGSRLVRVETYPSYGQWKVKNNDFKQDTNLNVRGVPAFYRIYPAPGKPHATYNRVVERWDQLEPLKVIFQGL